MCRHHKILSFRYLKNGERKKFLIAINVGACADSGFYLERVGSRASQTAFPAIIILRIGASWFFADGLPHYGEKSRVYGIFASVTAIRRKLSFVSVVPAEVLAAMNANR